LGYLQITINYRLVPIKKTNPAPIGTGLKYTLYDLPTTCGYLTKTASHTIHCAAESIRDACTEYGQRKAGDGLVRAERDRQEAADQPASGALCSTHARIAGKALNTSIMSVIRAGFF
jgi:hypothetical protein